MFTRGYKLKKRDQPHLHHSPDAARLPPKDLGNLPGYANSNSLMISGFVRQRWQPWFVECHETWGFQNAWKFMKNTGTSGHGPEMLRSRPDSWWNYGGLWPIGEMHSKCVGIFAIQDGLHLFVTGLGRGPGLHLQEQPMKKGDHHLQKRSWQHHHLVGKDYPIYIIWKIKHVWNHQPDHKRSPCFRQADLWKVLLFFRHAHFRIASAPPFFNGWWDDDLTLTSAFLSGKLYGKLCQWALYRPYTW